MQLQKVFLKGIIICLLFVLAIPVSALTPNDSLFENQWYLNEIDAPAAWDIATGDSGVVVAVLDTGIDMDHPDLIDNIWINEDEVAGDGIDNDKNGYVDDVNGWNFIEDNEHATPDFGQSFDEKAISHGTIIAGLIGAKGNNNLGIAGVNWNVQLMSVRILDDEGVGNSLQAAKGVQYAMENGAHVINLSFTGFDSDPHLRLALQDAYDAGIVVVAAVGNADEPGTNINSTPIYPVCYGELAEHDWIIGVASTTRQTSKSSFSNYGNECTDISAPGEEIFSTVYQDESLLLFADGFYQNGWSGTSVAAPLISGAAALLKGYHPSLTPKDIKTVLQLSVDPINLTPQFSGQLGAGRLNIAKAMEISDAFADEDEKKLVSPGTTQSSHLIAVSSEQDSSMIRVHTNSGEFLYEFDAYEDLQTGVRLAMGDVTGDGVEEIITVPSQAKAQVKIFSLIGKELNSFFAYEEEEYNGFFVATGDVNGNGKEEIAVSTDGAIGGGVKVLTWQGALVSSFVFSTEDNRELSTRVALGDVDGNGKDEIIIGHGSEMEPLVHVYSIDAELISEFYAYAKTYDKGIFVASGDLDGDGDDEIVTGTDNGGGPQVQIYDGQGTWLGTFFAYDKNFRGGVRLSVGNLSEWPGASIVTAAGPGGGPHIRVYNGYAKLIGTFFANNKSDRNGINSASWGL